MYGYGYQYGKISGSGLPFTPPLDVYTGAAAAYSLRLLRTAYAGSAIRVRRSSDNAEQDIGLTSGVLNTSSLLSFVSANGFTPKNYDQSGNAIDLSQTTAANQRQIVSSGALITSNSLAAIQGSTTTGGGTPSIAFSGMSEVWLFMVVDIASFTQQTICESTSNFNSNVGGFLVSLTSTNNEISINQRTGAGGSNYISYKYAITTGRHLITVRLRSGQTGTNAQSVWIDGVQVTGVVNLDNGTSSFIDAQLYLGARAGNTLGFTGKTQEFIMYGADQSANRAAIETNINSYYGIY